MTPSHTKRVTKTAKTAKTASTSTSSTVTRSRSRCPSLLSSHAVVARRTFSFDIIGAMLSFLPLHSLVAASGVDTQWRRASTNSKLWEAHLLQYFGSSLATVIATVEAQTAKGATPRSLLSLPSSSSLSPSSSISSHQSALQRLFVKQYLSVHSAREEVGDGGAEEQEEEARWKRHFANTFLQVQLWTVDKNETEEGNAEPKKRLLASETVCLADGDALLQLFGYYGIHLHMEEAGMETGLNLENPEAVASLQATMSFLDVAQDGTEDVRMAKVLVCTDYENMEEETGERGAFLPTYGLGEDHMFPHDVLQTGVCTLKYNIEFLMNNWGTDEEEEDEDSAGDDPSFPLHVHARVSIVRYEEGFHCECGECERPELEFDEKIEAWQHLAACLIGVRNWQ